MSLAEFRAELVDTINSAGIDCPLYMQETPQVPGAFVAYEVNDPLVFQHGAYSYTWHVVLVHGRGANEDAQAWFDTQLDTTSATSLYRVLMDASWEHCDYVRCTGAGEIQALPLAGGDALIVDITLEVVL